MKFKFAAMDITSRLKYRSASMYTAVAGPVATITFIGNTVNGLDIAFGNMRERMKQGKEYKIIELVGCSLFLALNIVCKSATYGLLWPFIFPFLTIKRIHSPPGSTEEYNSLSMQTRTVSTSGITYQLIPSVSKITLK